MRLVSLFRLLVAAAVEIVTMANSAVAQTPLSQYYLKRSENTTFEPLFRDFAGKKGKPKVFVVVGDLEDVIATPRYRPDGVVVPTNTLAQFEMPFPITQRVFVKRAKSSPGAMAALERVKAAALRYDGLPLGTGSFTTRIPAHARTIPGAVCMLSTDNRFGGSINQRDFFYQHRLTEGVGGCLKSLLAQGTSTVALPLVGSALFATADGALTGLERGLVKCRMLNSISAISRAAANSGSGLQEVAIILWTHDIERLFGQSRQDSRRHDFVRFASDVRATVARGLNGKETTADQVDFPPCETIFGLKNG